MYSRITRQITLEGAEKVVSAVVEECKTRGLEISVAVVDASGYLVSFARLDGAENQTPVIAQRKARSAAFSTVPSGRVSKAGSTGDDHHLLAITMAAGFDNVVTVAGGYPIWVDGECVGGIGISGAGGADKELAEIGAAAVA